MSRRTILAVASPLTQSAEAVKQLIAYQTHGQEPAEMPDFYRLTCDMVLVLSNKRDAYYVVTPNACSCPAAAYHPGQPCKHQRKYFSQELKQEAVDSIKPIGKWPGGHNGPVDEIPGVA